MDYRKNFRKYPARRSCETSRLQTLEAKWCLWKIQQCHFKKNRNKPLRGSTKGAFLLTQAWFPCTLFDSFSDGILLFLYLLGQGSKKVDSSGKWDCRPLIGWGLLSPDESRHGLKPTAFISLWVEPSTDKKIKKKTVTAGKENSTFISKELLSRTPDLKQERVSSAWGQWSRETETWGETGRAGFWIGMLAVYPEVLISNLQIVHIRKTTNNCMKNLNNNNKMKRSWVCAPDLLKWHLFLSKAKMKFRRSTPCTSKLWEEFCIMSLTQFLVLQRLNSAGDGTAWTGPARKTVESLQQTHYYSGV